MAPQTRYGSIPSAEDDDAAGGPLTPRSRGSGSGTADGGGGDAGRVVGEGPRHSSWLTRRHCFSYTLAALVCLVASGYWRDRAEGYGADGEKGNDDAPGGGPVAIATPPLSTLDPASDLGFRTAPTRSGLAGPSRAWGTYYSNGGEGDEGEGGEGGFAQPLPTNQWYLVSENDMPGIHLRFCDTRVTCVLFLGSSRTTARAARKKREFSRRNPSLGVRFPCAAVS